jgi:hygromycin-B 7''-O-kinase
VVDHSALLSDDDLTVFAGQLLTRLGLPTRPLVAAGGWSNRVWLAPAHVVRLSSGRFHDAFAHEAAMIAMLSPAIPTARVLGHGRVGQREWLVQRRLPGRPLAQVWPALSTPQRHAAARQLGTVLRALHGVPLPAGFANPWLTAALAPGGQLRDAYHAPASQYETLLVAAARVPGVDTTLLDELRAYIVERLPAFDGLPAVLVHGDIHFYNLLWYDGRISGLLDFEGAQPAIADQELDTLLRFCRQPALCRGPGDAAVLTGADLAAVPGWLAETYSELFAVPGLTARLAVYDALWHLVQLHHFPLDGGPHDPLGHLKTLLAAGDDWTRT